MQAYTLKCRPNTNSDNACLCVFMQQTTMPAELVIVVGDNRGIRTYSGDGCLSLDTSGLNTGLVNHCHAKLCRFRQERRVGAVFLARCLVSQSGQQRLQDKMQRSTDHSYHCSAEDIHQGHDSEHQE